MEIITEDYVSFETAELLNKNRFNAESLTAYYFFIKGSEPFLNKIEPQHFVSQFGENISLVGCPTLQMARKWLREKYEIDIIIFRHIRGERTTFFDRIEKRTHVERQSKCNSYLSYEQACEAAIKYCLENLI